MKAKFITMVLAIFVMSFGISFGQSLSLENVSGGMWHGQPDSMMAGSTYVFNIRVTSDASKHTGITNGFRVFSDDGATWTTTVGETTAIFPASNFDLLFSINPFSISGGGVYTVVDTVIVIDTVDTIIDTTIVSVDTTSVDSPADTIGFGGSGLFGDGLPAGYDEVSYTVTIGPIPAGAAHHGQTICFDSSFYNPTGAWKWAGAVVIPSWDNVEAYCYTVVDELSLGVNDGIDGLPLSFSLAQNYPNPFNPTTTIDYTLPVKSDVSLTIYNVTGQKVKEINEPQEAGFHSFEWDASTVASGVYFYKIVAGEFSETKKMMLLK